MRVFYDPLMVSYVQLVEHFWRHIDATFKDRQFCDVGSQYRCGIYWQNEAECKVAEESRDTSLKSASLPVIFTEVQPATTFWPSEEYHHYKKNPTRYAYYRSGCGRDALVQQVWGETK